jgi:hypothetical protein
MARDEKATHYPVPSDEDLARARDLLRRVGGPQVNWGAINVLEVLIGEHRLAMEKLAAQRLMRATWVLAGATIVLAIATVALIFATLAA